MQTIAAAINAALVSFFEASGKDAALSEQVLAAKAREVLTRQVSGVTFNEITVHKNENGKVRKVDVDYMDQVHDPSARSISIEF